MMESGRMDRPLGKEDSTTRMGIFMKATGPTTRQMALGLTSMSRELSMKGSGWTTSSMGKEWRSGRKAPSMKVTMRVEGSRASASTLGQMGLSMKESGSTTK